MSHSISLLLLLYGGVQAGCRAKKRPARRRIKWQQCGRPRNWRSLGHSCCCRDLTYMLLLVWNMLLCWLLVCECKYRVLGCNGTHWRWRLLFGRPFVKQFAAFCPMLRDRCPICLWSWCIVAKWNGWMDQDATWCRGRPWPRRHCVRWIPSFPPHRKGDSSSPLHFVANVCFCQAVARLSKTL